MLGCRGQSGKEQSERLRREREDGGTKQGQQRGHERSRLKSVH